MRNFIFARYQNHKKHLANMIAAAALATGLSVGGSPVPAFASSIALQNPTASYVQGGLGFAGIVTGTTYSTGWGIGGIPAPQTAVVQTVTPATSAAAGGLLTFTIYSGYSGGPYLLGDFRLSVTGDSTPSQVVYGGGAPWTVLTPLSATSNRAGTTLVIQGDNSILNTADVTTVQEVYTITARTNLTSITGFQIEALENGALAGRPAGNVAGPGISANGNFVLNGIQVSFAPVPEPSAFVLLALAGVAMFGYRLRSARRNG